MQKIKVMTTKGELEVEALHVWSQQILGAQFTFALHPAGVVARGFDVPLAISELSTGFDTKAVLLHPKNRTVLSMHSARSMPNKELKSRARAALHGLLKRVGEGRFVKAALGARIQIEVAKVQPIEGRLEKFEIAGQDLTSFFMPGAARLAPACEVCQDSKVVSTTEVDHEGNNIETTCPACIPKAIELPETPVSEFIGIASRDPVLMLDIDAPSEESMRARLSYLREQKDQHGTMTGDTTDGDYEDLCEEIDQLEQKLESKP